jgi:hypothetical protein
MDPGTLRPMGTGAGFGSLRHLAARFFGALSPAGPSPEDEAWALDWLLPGEQALWHRMSGPDRRHAVGVARDTLRLLDDGGRAPGRSVVAAALLHDVGKVESGFGTFSRVGVTLLALAAGRDRLTSGDAGGGPDGLSGRVRRYLVHDRLGADLLTAAGSDQLTVAWTAEHHLPPAEWSVDRRLADALKAADGD